MLVNETKTTFRTLYVCIQQYQSKTTTVDERERERARAVGLPVKVLDCFHDHLGSPGRCHSYQNHCRCYKYPPLYQPPL